MNSYILSSDSFPPMKKKKKNYNYAAVSGLVYRGSAVKVVHSLWVYSEIIALDLF